MVGPRGRVPPARAPRTPGATVCVLQDAGVTQRPTAAGCSTRVNLALRAGEIVAIAGVSGNGQQALAELLCGAARARRRHVCVCGGRALPATPRGLVDAGVARIPEDRHAVGVVGDLPLWENAVLERYATPAFARCGVVRRARGAWPMRGSLIERFDVRGTEAAAWTRRRARCRAATCRS